VFLVLSISDEKLILEILDLDIQPAGELFKLDQKFLSGHPGPLFLILNSLPEGNQQCGQILFLQGQQEIQVPVCLQQLQKLFQEFGLSQLAHTFSPLSKENWGSRPIKRLLPMNNIWLNDYHEYFDERNDRLELITDLDSL
jgi:hypothetical protein